MLTIEQEMAQLRAENAKLKLENQANAIANANISSNTDAVAFKPDLSTDEVITVKLKDGRSMKITFVKMLGGRCFHWKVRNNITIAEYMAIRKDRRFKINHAVKQSNGLWNVKFGAYV